MAVMVNEMNALGWWKINKPSYPKHAKLARSVLCILANSSSRERVFSAAGRTISECLILVSKGFSNDNSILIEY